MKKKTVKKKVVARTKKELEQVIKPKKKKQKKKVTKANFDWINATRKQKIRQLKSMLGNINWHKYGGYYDKKRSEYCRRLSEHGFHQINFESRSSPDGSSSSSSDYYMDSNGNIAILYRHIGSTKYDNNHSFTAIPCGDWIPKIVKD